MPGQYWVCRDDISLVTSKVICLTSLRHPDGVKSARFELTGPTMKIRYLLILVMSSVLSGCASTYYNAWEKVGFLKSDILVSRVEKTRDSQEDAQEEFKDALEQFGSIVALQNTDLKQAYDRLSSCLLYTSPSPRDRG